MAPGFLLLSTHRRGVALALVKNLSSFAELYSICCALVAGGQEGDVIFEKSGIFLARTQGKTAENLYELYDRALSALDLQDSAIGTLAVGVGPGSFTGLRLGCAFANGLALGRKRQLVSVATLLVPQLKAFCQEQGFPLQALEEQLGDYEESDESTGTVTFYDILALLFLLKSESPQLVDSFMPNYGREPGPVLKLRELLKT